MTPKSLNKQQNARASDLGTAWPAPPVTAIYPATSGDLSRRIAVPGGIGQLFLYASEKDLSLGQRLQSLVLARQ